MTTSPSPCVPSAPPIPQLFVGIDVAKYALDLARSDTGELLHLPNDKAGIGKIVAALTKAQPICIVLEATGGLEEPLLEALLDANLPVARVNPGKVRHLAKGLGILAKTDAIDAAVLVEFARLAAPRLAVKRSENQAQLDALVTCRRQLVSVQTDQTNRLKATTSKPAQKALRAVLHVIEKQILSLNQQIAQIIDSDDDMKHIHQRIEKVPGVGAVLSSTLIAQLRELGHSDRQEISALVGVAPFNHDSGKHRGKRAIRGGRTDLRNVLYMGAQSAIRHNPVIRPFAERLQKAGKAPKVIVVACMRKLLTLLNAMIRDNLAWDQLNVVKKLSPTT